MKKTAAIEFCYHWMDREGKLHFTPNREEADKALHSGYQIYLVIKDEQHLDGTCRKAE